ncbi:sensor histidine kinase [Croceitalea marina]|uniref:Sensor histidine kinase n=1 Tax=Croceitalea marina TaxID=1775166 RepID=A0ABW5N2L1_9FLAO
MKAKNKERLFWLLQLAGWGVTNGFIFVFPFGFSTKYMIYSFLTATLLGILTTSLYRAYLRKNVGLSFNENKKVLKLLGAFLVCSISYFGLVISVEYLYESIWERTESELAFIKENMSFGLALFNVFFTIFGWTAIYYGVNLVLKANKNNLEKLELNATLKEAQLNTLRGQVNPHFMFNSLNNIRGLMLEDVDKSSEMITKLSEMLQFAMAKNSVDAIPIKDELEMVENYISLSKIQMEDRLQFEKDIDDKVLDSKIPPMIIQLLVENAAKHGIANLKNGGIIKLQIAKSEDILNILVSNTGKLQIAENSTQLGLKNIKQRLRLLYGEKASFSLSEVGEEVVAEINIPQI